MIISGREATLTIKEWRRTIGEHRYKFNVAYFETHTVFSVWKRRLNKPGEAEIHRWTVDSSGKIKGIYRREGRNSVGY